MSNKIYDVDIIPDILSESILSLMKDNEQIKERINLIYETINILSDDNVWMSPEKPVIMDELMPYIEKSKNNIYEKLNNCVDLLKLALDDYLVNNNLLEKDAKKLVGSEIIEEP